jgi:DNA-binding beta-propeller fold protein YncE
MFLKRSFFIFIVLLVSDKVMALSQESFSKNYWPQNLIITPNTQAIPLKLDGSPLAMGMACSITLIDQNHLFFCNYTSVYCVDITTGEAKKVNPPAEIKKWRPTGLKYLPKQKLLYVANYKGEDVLIFKVGNDLELKLIKQVTDAALKGPENIDITKDGKFFVIADYDSSKIILFNQSGNKLWEKSVGMAHGVSFSKDENYIFASGLKPASLHKFDMKGNVVKKVGEESWGKNGYLWATCLQVSGDEVFVSDAHTGKISALDDELSPKYCIGGNGLGADLLNMPYAIACVSNDLAYVTDTFKGRILLINLKDGEVLKVYQSKPVDQVKGGITPLVKKTNNVGKHIPIGKNYTHRINKENKFRMDGLFSSDNLWYAGYASIQSEMSKKKIEFKGLTGLYSSSFYYWCFGCNYTDQSGSYTILGSPQNREWLVYHQGILIPVSVGFDFWLTENLLTSSNGKQIEIADLVAFAKKNIKAYAQDIKKGIHPLNAMAEHLFGIKKFNNNFEKTFVSQKGQLFYKNIKARLWKDKLWKTLKGFLGLQEPVDNREIQKIARNFLEQIKNDQELELSEICIAKMILFNSHATRS